MTVWICHSQDNVETVVCQDGDNSGAIGHAPVTYLSPIGDQTVTVYWPKFPITQRYPEEARPIPGQEMPSPLPPPLPRHAPRGTGGEERPPHIGSPASSEQEARKEEARRANVEAEVRATWPLCLKAAAMYGKDWGPLTPSRLQLMADRLREFDGYDSKILVSAIHGCHEMLKSNSDGDSFVGDRYIDPKTIYAPEKFPSYVEACDDWQAAEGAH